MTSFRIAICALAVAGCRQIAGIDDRAASQPTCGAAATGAGPCASCITASCCDEARVCSDDTACAALVPCLDACAGSAACQTDCRNAHPDGFGNAAAALLACRARSCASACGASTCGGYIFASDVCASCASKSCCSQATACSADAECSALAFCDRGCGDDLACASRCSTVHAAGWDAEQRLAGCVHNQCDVVCGGRAWDCVGSVVWPSGTGTVKWQLKLTDFVTGKNLPGVTCKPCSRTDPACTSPLQPPQLTDDTGSVAFVLTAGFDGYIDATGGGIYPGLFFPPKPLTADYAENTLVVTEAAFPTLAALLGTPDPERGHLTVNALDCTGGAAAHVAFQANPSDAETIPFYLAQNLPSKAATETDSTGRGGFGNLQPGAVTVRAVVQPIGLVASESTVLVRKGTFSYKPMPPTP